MSGHHTLVGSSKPRQWRDGRAFAFQPTAKMYALAYPPESRVPAICPGCGKGIAFGGVWFDFATDTRHSCPQVDRMAAAG